MRLSLGGDRLEPSKLDIAEIIQNEVTSINAVVGDGSPEKSDDEPPTTVLSSLNAPQHKTFLRLWKKIPAYVRAIPFDFEENPWTAADIDARDDLLCNYAHVSLNIALIWNMLRLILSALF